MIPLITVEGATASGKSSLAIELARALGSQIISADSRQVYRHMDIGTAKVSKPEQQIVPHHLIDIINPDEAYNAGAFAEAASSIISDLWQQGIIPIVCGGTGLYIRSLLQGLFKLPYLPPELRKQLKQRLQNDGLEILYEELQSLDPFFAASISSNDSQRILRGLEVAQGTGMPLSEHWQRQERQSPYHAYRILVELPRHQLYQRINDRIQQMLLSGLIEEIKALFTRGYTETSPGLNSLGYKEFIPFLQQQDSLENCTALAAQHHRNYAKRQCTWYRKCTFDLTLNPLQVTLSEIISMVKHHFSRGRQCK